MIIILLQTQHIFLLKRPTHRSKALTCTFTLPQSWLKIKQSFDSLIPEMALSLISGEKITKVPSSKLYYFGLYQKGSSSLPLSVDGETFFTFGSIDHRLTWLKQVDKVKDKGKKLSSDLKFIRRKLSKEQFLKVLTSQYNGWCFYGCNIWMA